MIITTTANRVKSGPYWCEEADEITRDTIQGTEYNWDSEIPVTWILEHGGLANTLLALGSVRPRFQGKADLILVNYVRKLYGEIAQYANKIFHTEVTRNVAHWIGDPNRAMSCKSMSRAWLKLQYSNTEEKLIYEAIGLMFSDQVMVLRAIHATKNYLGAHAIRYGFKETDIIKQDLIKYVENELQHAAAKQ